MSSISGRSNSNERGNSYGHRVRRAWLVSPAAGFGGDGVKVPCWECERFVTVDDLVVDRIISGGRYVRTNIRPHCPNCSCRSGQRRTVSITAARRVNAAKAVGAVTRTDHWHDDEGRYVGPFSCSERAWPPIEACNDVPEWAVIALELPEILKTSTPGRSQQEMGLRR